MEVVIEENKMHTGELCRSNDEQILEVQKQCLEKLYDFNHTRPSEGKKENNY